MKTHSISVKIADMPLVKAKIAQTYMAGWSYGFRKGFLLGTGIALIVSAPTALAIWLLTR